MRGMGRLVNRFMSFAVNPASGRTDLHSSFCKFIFLSHVIFLQTMYYDGRFHSALASLNHGVLLKHPPPEIYCKHVEMGLQSPGGLRATVV